MQENEQYYYFEDEIKTVIQSYTTYFEVSIPNYVTVTGHKTFSVTGEEMVLVTDGNGHIPTKEQGSGYVPDIQVKTTTGTVLDRTVTYGNRSNDTSITCNQNTTYDIPEASLQEFTSTGAVCIKITSEGYQTLYYKFAITIG